MTSIFFLTSIFNHSIHSSIAVFHLGPHIHEKWKGRIETWQPRKRQKRKPKRNNWLSHQKTKGDAQASPLVLSCHPERARGSNATESESKDPGALFRSMRFQGVLSKTGFKRRFVQSGHLNRPALIRSFTRRQRFAVQPKIALGFRFGFRIFRIIELKRQISGRSLDRTQLGNLFRNRRSQFNKLPG